MPIIRRYMMLFWDLVWMEYECIYPRTRGLFAVTLSAFIVPLDEPKNLQSQRLEARSGRVTLPFTTELWVLDMVALDQRCPYITCISYVCSLNYLLLRSTSFEIGRLQHSAGQFQAYQFSEKQ